MNLVIKDGILIDGTGSPPVRGDVVVAEGRISRIGPQAGGRKESEKIIDAGGKYVLPGFINCHVHLCLDTAPDCIREISKTDSYQLTLQGMAAAGRMLRAGITTARDVGSKHFESLAIREAINGGLFPGPRMIVAGQALLMTGGHFAGLQVDGVNACLAGARTQLHHGADLIKVMATGGMGKPGELPGAQELSFEELKACVDVAKRAGKPSAAHAHGTAAIKDAIEAGVNSIEHGTMLDDEVMDLMIQSGTYLVPTLAAYWLMAVKGEERGIPGFMVKSCQWVMEEKVPRFKKAFKKGVKIAFGTDGGGPINPHEDLAVECRCLVENGMTPMEVLRSLGPEAATLLRLEKEIGTLEAGKRADMVLLEGNPLEDIANVARVVQVIKEGQPV